MNELLSEEQKGLLANRELYSKTLRALAESDESYIKTRELEDQTGYSDGEATAFLDILRQTNYISGQVREGEYHWNTNPEKTKWMNVKRILDEGLKL